MRLVTVVTLSVALLAPSSAGGARAQRSEPFVAVGVWYPGGTATPAAPANGDAPRSDRDLWTRELAAIKAAGFNSIRTVVDWASVEPERGQYRFDWFGEILSVADEAGLKVIVQVDADVAPGWMPLRYQDSAVLSDPGTRRAPATTGYCQDHPGVRADLGAFIGAAATAAARHRAFYAIDVWRNPGVSSDSSTQFCYCPYTQARFRDALQRKYRSLGALNAAWGQSFSAWSDVHAPRDSGRPTTDILDWQQFFAVKLQEDLKFRADASAPRGPRPVTSHSGGTPRSGVDDWLMTTAVDHYGTSIPWVRTSETSEPARLMASLDAMRSAARDKRWWVGALHAGAGADDKRPTNIAPGADVRLRAWAAISRGAGAISYHDWPGMNGGAAADAAVPDRVRAAGEVAGVVGRNSSLFGPLRPHASSIAIIHQPGSLTTRESGTATSGGSDSLLEVYKALFDRNIQVDFIHPDEVVAGFSTRYGVVYTGDAAALSRPVAEALKGFVRGGGTLIAERSGVSRTVPGSPISAQGLDDFFAESAKPWRSLRSIAPDASATTSSSRPDARGREPDVMAASYGSGRAFLIGRPGSVVRGSNVDARQSAGDLLQRMVAAAGVKPEIRIDVTGGLVEARFLESSGAMLLIAMNHASTPRTVTFTFAPDVPEAIWQNMVTGAAVNFVQGAEGATYTRTFAGRDVMVLVRGKRLR